jgi:DNA-binding MarR family transcriptional regulator
MMPDEIEGRFRENYPSYQYHFVEFLTEHLSDVSREFGGDLQEMLVLAIIGQMHLRAVIDTQTGSVASQQIRQNPPQITASRIADASGIPRETVRRKLAKLGKRGWIEQGADGAWRLVVGETSARARARDDLFGLDSRGIARVAGFYSRLQGLLR